MRPSTVLVPAVIANVVVWWIYLAGDRGFPWPVFVTLASVVVLVAQYQRGPRPADTGRQRNRNRNRNRDRR